MKQKMCVLFQKLISAKKDTGHIQRSKNAQISFLAEVEFFSFCPNTMDYSKAFISIKFLSALVNLILTERCHGAELLCQNARLGIPFLMVSCMFRRSHISGFWSKTMDNSKAFRSNTLTHLYLLTGRCHRADN